MSLNRHFGEGVRNRFKSHRAERKPKSHSTLQGFYVHFDFALRARNLVSHWSRRMSNCDWNDQLSWKRGGAGLVVLIPPVSHCSILFALQHLKKMRAGRCHYMPSPDAAPHQTGFQHRERGSSMCFLKHPSSLGINYWNREGPEAKCFSKKKLKALHLSAFFKLTFNSE